jgi:ABC-type lipoprotein export system ATPase subunit
MKIAIHKEVTIEPTIRTELLSSMFEVPATSKLSVSLSGDLNVDSQPWNIGLIVGPSGSGKTLLLNELFGHPQRQEWNRRSVIDDFPLSYSMEDISRVCQSVGFNTIPSWLRPYSVLSNGERFRAETARYLLDGRDPVVIDEFTSVVDRGVAQFACHSIQKFVREKQKRLVVASCHYDILDWLQPDWILEPGNPCRFTWRSLHGRPPISCKVQRVKYETWELFREFHYMSAELNRAARCYGLYVSSNEHTTGMGVPVYTEDIRASSVRDSYNLGLSRGLRLPSGLGMHAYTFDSEVVSREDNSSRESESFRPEQISESEIRPLIKTLDESISRPLIRGVSFGSGNSSMREGSRRRTDEDESLHQLSREKTGCSEKTVTPTTAGSIASSHGDESNETSVVRPDEIRSELLGSRRPSNPYRIASLCGVLYRPHPRVSDIYGFTRMVTLPDFQGLGLAFVLACKVASAYKALGKRLHSYPNHPAWIRSYQRSSDWIQVKQSGTFSPQRGSTSSVSGFGGRRCAVFMYVGPEMNKEEAERLVHAETE